MGISLQADTSAQLIPVYQATLAMLDNTPGTFSAAYMTTYGSSLIYGNVLTVVQMPSPSPPPVPEQSVGVKSITAPPNAPVASPPGASTPASSAKAGPSKALVAAAAVLGVAAAAAAVVAGLMYRRNRRKAKYTDNIDFSTNPIYGGDKDTKKVRASQTQLHTVFQQGSHILNTRTHTHSHTPMHCLVLRPHIMLSPTP